jgi:hypothetical protein
MQSRVLNGVFDPETIRILTAVFEDAWRALDGTGDAGPLDDAKRDELANLIIRMAQYGERDPSRLREQAVSIMRLMSTH